MTGARWLRSVVWCIVWCAAGWAATQTIENAWGLVILAAVYLSAFSVLVNTIDLCCGRWIRRGEALGTSPAPGQIVRHAVITEIVLGRDRDEWPRPARRD